jgi:MFS family permease
MTRTAAADAPGAPAPLPAAPQVPWPRPAYAWYAVTLLMLAYALGVVDRIVIGLLVDPIKADLGLTNTQMGVIQGLAFGLFYACFALPVGFIVDRWKRVPVLWMGLLLWSCATMACGLAGSFAALFAARVAIGAGESSTTPGSSSLIADYFPPAQRAKAYGVFMMGGAVGIGVAYQLGGTAIRLAGTAQQALPGVLGALKEWQVVFMIVGAPGLLLALLMWATLREPLRRGGAAVSTRLSLRPLWHELRINRLALSAVMLGTIMNVMIVNAQLGWFPTLFTRVHHWPREKVAQALALVGTPLGLFSAVTAGWALSWLIRRGRRDGPILVMALQCAVWTVFGTLKCLAPTPELTLAGHVITSLFATWAVTAALTALNEITPNALRGQVVAVYTLLTALVGIGLGPFLVGALLDHVFTGPTGVGASLALVCAVGGLLGIAMLLYGRTAYMASLLRARSWGEMI